VCCLCLHNNNHNGANKQQSLNFDENQAEQETEFQITCYKAALYYEELFYVVYLHCDLFHSWFLHDLCHF